MTTLATHLGNAAGRSAVDQSIGAELDRILSLLEGHGERTPVPPIESVADLTSPLGRVASAFGLTPFERDIVALTVGIELDPAIAAIVAKINGHGVEPRPTLSQCLETLPDGHWDALLASSPLRFWNLIELDPAHSLAKRPMRIDERILSFVVGDSAIDARLYETASFPNRRALATSQLQLADRVKEAIDHSEQPTVVVVSGSDLPTQLGVCQAAIERLGRRPLVIRLDALAGSHLRPAEIVRLLDREVVLGNVTPILLVGDRSGDALMAYLDHTTAPLALLAGELAAIEGTTKPPNVLAFEVSELSHTEQRAMWLSAIETDNQEVRQAIDVVSYQHSFSAHTIWTVARQLRASSDDLDATSLTNTCRQRARFGLDGLGQRVEASVTWSDLVLPAGPIDLVRGVAQQVRARSRVYGEWGFGDRTSSGTGVTALFAGESGTGKTMASEVLANDLDLDLYRIDLAATVSKYIGETEKNLGRVFDAAEASGAILLFDEADALFAKRGEVKDSHDRYANLEVAYLLQRMEAYQGLAILTTNLSSNIDRAFVRRFRFIIQFPFPDHRQRAEIWRRVFPSSAPLDGLDVDRLAQLTIAGGSIWSIALAASFAAADARSTISMEHIKRAAQVEYAKLDRVLTSTETAGWA